MKFYGLVLISLSGFLLSTCGMINEKNKGKGINLFTVSQDKELGAQVASEIDGNPTEYPVLDPLKYKDVYDYLNKVRDKILNAGGVDYKDEFEWRLRVIHDDNTLNAFCTPGGYIYIYTGILKYLDSEDQFAGVLGHEIAHADMRHSTRQMTTMNGIDFMLQVLAGDQVALASVTSQLVGLKFSRNHETEADQKSVEYLCRSDYNADGGAGFFEKIQAEGGSKTPQFLSTHPDPGNRIEHFHSAAVGLGCPGRNNYAVEYKQMLSKLPK
jgi:predicted Zn-dependent protease